VNREVSQENAIMGRILIAKGENAFPKFCCPDTRIQRAEPTIQPRKLGKTCEPWSIPRIGPLFRPVFHVITISEHAFLYTPTHLFTLHIATINTLE
jgi:hypothetical protein